MTLAEIDRALQSNERVEKARKKERAIFDYTLASLIGRNIARVYNSTNTIPSISEVYTGLFDAEEEENERQQRQDEISIIRFKQFTQSYNTKYKEGENQTNERTIKN